MSLAAAGAACYTFVRRNFKSQKFLFVPPYYCLSQGGLAVSSLTPPWGPLP